MSLSLEEKEKKSEHLKEIVDDLTTTFHFYQLAAETGNALAHYYLGRCYQTGRGVTVSLSDARRCFKIVVDHYPENHPKAQLASQRLQSIPSTIPTPVVIPTIEVAKFEESEEKELGGGGQGKVYQNKWRDEVVAVKYFSAHITEVKKQAQRLTEAKTNQSDYLMQVKALCLKPPCVVLEYISESNLSQFLGARPNITWLHRYRLAHDIIQGVAYLHKQGLLHRDLKSKNIMVRERPRLHTKLCDFDSLKKNQAGETGSTSNKTTPYYLDPRYLEGPSEPSMSYAWYNEIYNLGCVLLEITTCKDLPSVHIHGNDFYIRKEQKDIPLRDSIPTNCPTDFAELIRDCLRYDTTLQPRAEVLVQRMTALLEAEQYKFANTPDEKGHTPLMQAICHGKIGKIATLLDCKADVNFVDSHGYAPLFWAVQGGKQAFGMTQLLLEAKADLTILGPKQPMSILQAADDYAHRYPHWSTVKVFVSSQNKLIKACENGSLTKVKSAIAEGALVDSSNAQGKSPLYCAVYGMNLEVIIFLIEQLANKPFHISWEDCREHNIKHYGQIFLNLKFNPITYREWSDLLTQMEENEFLIHSLLIQAKKVWGANHRFSEDFMRLKNHVMGMEMSRSHSLEVIEPVLISSIHGAVALCARTEFEYLLVKIQIKRLITDVPFHQAQQNKFVVKNTHLDEEEQARLMSLQIELVKACEIGNLAEVKAVIARGALVNLPDEKGKYPLYSAVWGMNPEVLQCIIEDLEDGVTTITWQNCEKHNLTHYGQIFLNIKFVPHSYGEWHALLTQLEFNKFLSEYHLKQARKIWGESDKDCASFVALKEYAQWADKSKIPTWRESHDLVCNNTEIGYDTNREQIIQEIKALATKQIQNELITACKNGSLVKVKAAITRGALVDRLNGQGKNPLYCAVYGMNFEVVNYIMAQRSENSLAYSWQSCENHNKKHYGQTFFNMKFYPSTYRAWYDLLIKFQSSEFLSNKHLTQVHKVLGNSETVSFIILKNRVSDWCDREENIDPLEIDACSMKTEEEFEISRKQIRQKLGALQEPQADEETTGKRQSSSNYEISWKQEVLKEKKQRVAERVETSTDEVKSSSSPSGKKLNDGSQFATAPTDINVPRKLEKKEITPFMTQSKLVNPESIVASQPLNTTTPSLDVCQFASFSRNNSSSSSTSSETKIKKPRDERKHQLLMPLQNELIMACENGSLPKVKSAPSSSTAASVPTFFGRTSSLNATSNEIKTFTLDKQKYRLQNELITACEQGDLITVKLVFAQRAMPNILNELGKNAFYCAVWGMNPEIFSYLIEYAEGTTFINWKDCQEHNLKHYGQLFLNIKFDPYTYGDWFNLLKQIETNRFLSELHLSEMKTAFRPGHRGSSLYQYTETIEKLKILASRFPIGSSLIGLPAGAGIMRKMGKEAGVLTDKPVKWPACFVRTEAKFTQAKEQIRQLLGKFELEYKQPEKKEIPLREIKDKNQFPITHLQELKTPTLPLSHNSMATQSAHDSSLYASSSTFFSIDSDGISRKAKTPMSDAKKQPIIMSLQNELVKACEEGDLLRVKASIAKGASPDFLNEQGKNPIYCAVWGMNPAVVNYLEQNSSISCTWEDCEKHNRERYGAVFMLSNFQPTSFNDWHRLLLKMEPNEFLKNEHLKQVQNMISRGPGWPSSWSSLKQSVIEWSNIAARTRPGGSIGRFGGVAFYKTIAQQMEGLCFQYRKQIEMSIKKAYTNSKNF